MPSIPLRLNTEIALYLFAGLPEAPAAHPHQQIHPGPPTAQMVFAAALVAEPGAVAVPVVKAVAIPAPACGAGLVAIAELLGLQPCQHLENVSPAA